MTAYVTISEADEYFAYRLHTEAWSRASDADKEKALQMASNDIDHLNYIGSKYSETQEHEFPRDFEEDVVNDDVKRACFEIALARLDGVDPDKELENSAVTSQAFAGTRVSFDRRATLEHIRAGIASIAAWRYLKPWLRDPQAVVLRKV